MAGNLVVTRTFDAPRETVFEAFANPKLFQNWWGPKDFSTPFCRIDFRVGGSYHYCMRSPEGKDFWGIGVYREIVRPERITCTDSFADEKGNVVPATHYGMGADFPLEMVIKFTFREDNGRTKFTLEHIGMPESDHEMCSMGWNQSFDKLEAFLKQSRSKQVA